MRLVAFLLSGAALLAQGPALPWMPPAPLPWRSALPEPPPEPPVLRPPQGATLKVAVSPDGTLRLTDARGVVRLRAGLPGRPLRAWRDGGVPLAPPHGTWVFPASTPLSRGVGSLPTPEGDFRPVLEGLLWILDDGEPCLTVVHPATGRILHLALPAGEHLGVAFYPDRLGVHQLATSVAQDTPRLCWSLPWMSLLPQLLQLARPQPLPPPGGALRPFPQE